MTAALKAEIFAHEGARDSAIDVLHPTHSGNEYPEVSELVVVIATRSRGIPGRIGRGVVVVFKCGNPGQWAR